MVLANDLVGPPRNMHICKCIRKLKFTGLVINSNKALILQYIALNLHRMQNEWVDPHKPRTNAWQHYMKCS